jgi:hypothetical protein
MHSTNSERNVAATTPTEEQIKEGRKTLGQKDVVKYGSLLTPHPPSAKRHGV